MHEMKDDVTKVKSELSEIFKHSMSTEKKIPQREMKSDSPNFSKDLQLEEIQSEITNVKAKLEEVHLVNRSLEAKLNAVLEKLG